MQRYRGDINRDLITVGRASLAEKITGGLSNPGKMPEAAWAASGRLQRGFGAGQRSWVCLLGLLCTQAALHTAKG